MARRRYNRLDGAAGARRREFVLSYQNYICAITGCHSIATEVDHIRPLHRGGADTLENLQGLCASCHAMKTSKERKKWTKRPRKRKDRINGPWREFINQLCALHKH